MPVENALGFLRIVEIAKTLPAAILIAGPQAFLREYLVDAIARRLTREGLQYRTFQIANASDFASVVEELRAPDLFAPKRMLVCRVMRSFRDRGGDENTPADDSTEKETRGGDAGLIGAVTEARAPNHLVIVYDKDAAPAKIRRAAESAGILVNCLRPFDNQLPQYTQSFARALDLKLSQSAAELLIARHGGDLSAVANALGKLAILLEKGASIEAADLSEQGPSKLPEPFEIAESLSAGKTTATLAQLTRALALGNVVVHQADRQGSAERADYTAAGEKFVLSGGQPTLTDAANDTTTGRSLTFYRASDTIFIDSEAGSRTLTKHQVEK